MWGSSHVEMKGIFFIKKKSNNAIVVSNQNIWEVTVRICDLCTVKLGA